MKKKVIKHLKDDVKMFKHEVSEDRGLIKELKKRSPMKAKKRKLSTSKKVGRGKKTTGGACLLLNITKKRK